MSWVDILMLGIMIVGFIVVGLIKGMPVHLLNRNLESFKSDLQKDMDNIRISNENIHPMKIEEYVEFSKVYLKIMDLGKITNARDITKRQKEVFDGLSRFGFAVMFFGNDETVKKYVELRKYSTLPAEQLGENEKAKMMIVMSELIVLMRRDVGHNDSKVSIDDFLTIIIKDWDTSKEEFMRRADNAIKFE